MKLHLSPEFLRGILVAFIAFEVWNGASHLLTLIDPLYLGQFIAGALFLILSLWLLTLLLFSPFTCAKVVFRIFLVLSIVYTVVIGLGSMLIFRLDNGFISPIEEALFQNGVMNIIEFIGATVVAYLYYKMQNGKGVAEARLKPHD